jgi:uncharacterized phiE125 gp8 family phage protein
MAKPISCPNSLVLIDAPLVTPVTLAEAKAQLRVEHGDEDDLISRLIGAAVAFVDVKGALGHAMISQKWGQWVGPNVSGKVRLILGPVIEVNAVKYYDDAGDLQTDTLANYEVNGAEFANTIGPKDGYSWPSAADRSDAIRIEYTVGYGEATTDVPETLRHALLMLIGHWYENREQATLDDLSVVPFGFDDLLNMHRNCWYG